MIIGNQSGQSRARLSLTSEQIEKAEQLRRTGRYKRLAWKKIAKEIGVPWRQLEAYFVPAVRQRIEDEKRISQTLVSLHMRDTNMVIPREVLADRERRLSLAPSSLTALLCGDPLPGCSAIDKRLLGLVVSNHN